MEPISFFKLQAKNLHKDYKTQYIRVEYDGTSLFDYNPKYFDVNSIICDYDYDEVEAENFSLMKSQHLFSKLMGFDKWSNLINAPEKLQELLILLFKNKIHLEDWDYRVSEFDEVNSVKSSFEEQIGLLEFCLERGLHIRNLESCLIHDFELK
ncbi:hypothetical protein AADZ86_08635 [Colwelliaceae bacterium BS250]